MKLPRDVSGSALVRGLGVLGYAATRQQGSHVRLTTEVRGEHHVTIPLHDPLKVGTLSAVLKSVAAHHGLTLAELLGQIRL
ncbi:MAG TPA: type II toxin-antitoxin system HicA family toxin [Caulifigura sp.]|jgi:predicted RNA binding protein YcfA (HicA-like mRNA interferase family)|nr:type II toxin-antitoxin system HicA family toxin [Caulifigura sp.]